MFPYILTYLYISFSHSNIFYITTSIFYFRTKQKTVKAEIYPGRAEGLQLVLDAHTDKVSSGSVSDNFRGFHVVIDGKEKYPFTTRNGILIKSGQANEVVISATRFESNQNIKSINPDKRNCYFSEELGLKLHRVYSQANCFFQCKIEYTRDLMFKQNNKTEERCVPWFYPVEDKYLYEICDPWETKRFQALLKEVSDDQCSECLPDCRRTKYKTSISAAPFKECDRTNLGISSLCSLNTDTAHMMINPPIWKNAIQGEYKKFNNGSLPTFIENQQGVFSNIRNYSSSDEELRNLVFRAQREKKLTYNALEEDITVVNFYFDESDVIQYTTFQRMTIIDFISSVR